MKDSIKEKVEQDTADWEYLTSLPASWHGFTFKREMNIVDDRYELFSYNCEERHRQAVAYYHEETKEYKLRVRIGLTEFCRIDCISADKTKFETLMRERFESVLAELEHFDPASLGSMVAAKKIIEWKYQQALPETYRDFELFIRPSEPVKITNGSYIVFDYEDFATESNFIVYYNVYRDEFSGEARIRKIPDVNYNFDSRTIPELEQKLSRLLLPRLDEVYMRAKSEVQI